MQRSPYATWVQESRHAAPNEILVNVIFELFGSNRIRIRWELLQSDTAWCRLSPTCISKNIFYRWTPSESETNYPFFHSSMNASIATVRTANPKQAGLLACLAKWTGVFFRWCKFRTALPDSLHHPQLLRRASDFSPLLKDHGILSRHLGNFIQGFSIQMS